MCCSLMCPFLFIYYQRLTETQNSHLPHLLCLLFVIVCVPRGFAVSIEWSVSRATVHLDTGWGPPAGWQHGEGGKGADSGESPSRAQWIHVSLHRPESSGFHRYAYSPHRLWYVCTDLQAALAPFGNAHNTCIPTWLPFNRELII